MLYRYAAVLYKNAPIREYEGLGTETPIPLLEKGSSSDLVHLSKQYSIFIILLNHPSRSVVYFVQ